MFVQVLTPETKHVFEKLQGKPWMKKFYLAGGTALALQYGHRQSIDLDWFCERSFQTQPFINRLSQAGVLELLNVEDGTVDGILDNVKVSFFHFPYKLLRKTVSLHSVRLAHPLDIACMKLNAIAGRNAKKDFLDLYVFLKREEMDFVKLLQFADKKFGDTKLDRYHILRSLTYFVEADEQPMPKMAVPLDWDDVKTFFIRETRRISKQ